ncbi:MAG TPA: PorV/PorQ family protein [Candidatus Deferrimicrobium sp.]|nr:PorV/PorQ family protein [Candidatus Deferrimicrobium sp.]
MAYRTVRTGHRRTRRRLVSIGAMALALAIGLSPAQVQAQAKVGTTGTQFLELGVSARAMGMGEAFVAIADDISSAYYNPAGLTYLYGREAAFTYIRMPADINYGFAALGLPLEAIGGVLGIGMYGLSSGDIEETDYARAPTGRTFVWNDYALAVSYGRYLTDRFSVGLTVKYIGQFVHDYSANGWAADVGTLYNTGFRGFKIGMAITNFGPDMTFIRNAFPLPINFKFGGAINVIEGGDHLVTFAAEGAHPSDNLEEYNSGVEYVYKDNFVLRSGWRFNYDLDGFTAGGGLRLPFGEDRELRVDYAFQDFGILTEVHRFTMIMAF